MERKIAVAGNSGLKVRSDCELSLDLSYDKGIVINIDSRVRTMYGQAINDLCLKILDHYSIKKARLFQFLSLLSLPAT